MTLDVKVALNPNRTNQPIHDLEFCKNLLSLMYMYLCHCITISLEYHCTYSCHSGLSNHHVILSASIISVFCYQARTHGAKKNDCNAKEGNPFGPFWNTFNVEFDKSEFFAPLYYDTTNLHEIQRWKERCVAFLSL